MLRDLGRFNAIAFEDVAIDPPTGHTHKVIPPNMDLKLKFHVMDSTTEYKGRWVQLDNQEWPDSLRDVLSPTVNSRTINLLVALTAQQGTIH